MNLPCLLYPRAPPLISSSPLAHPIAQSPRGNSGAPLSHELHGVQVSVDDAEATRLLKEMTRVK